MKHIFGVIVILIVSVITGVAAKAMWYDTWSPTKAAPPQKMAWVKQDASDSTTKTVADRKQPNTNDDASKKTNNNDANDSAVATDASDHSDATVSNDEPEFSGGFPVAKLDMVVDHLTDGTAHFVDAREEYEFDEGHLKGAHLLPSSAIYENIENLMAVGVLPGPGKPIIVYCGGGSCEASHNVAKVMAEFDYQNIYIYVNGWEEVMAEPDRFAGLTE